MAAGLDGAVRSARPGRPSVRGHHTRAICAFVSTVMATVTHVLGERRGALRHDHPRRVVDVPACRRRPRHGDAVAPRRVEAGVGDAGRDVPVVGVGEVGNLQYAIGVNIHGRIAPAVPVGGEPPGVALCVVGVCDLPAGA